MKALSRWLLDQQLKLLHYMPLALVPDSTANQGGLILLHCSQVGDVHCVLLASWSVPAPGLLESSHRLQTWHCAIIVVVWTHLYPKVPVIY